MENKHFKKINCFSICLKKVVSLKKEKSADQTAVSFLRLLFLAVFFFAVLIPYIHAEETYTIKKGDNLWDISKSSDKNPSKWREIWRLNPFITNPNLIFPGETIRLKPAREMPRVNKVIKLKKKEVKENKVKPAIAMPVQAISQPVLVTTLA